jgi:hypothetical protein
MVSALDMCSPLADSMPYWSNSTSSVCDQPRNWMAGNWPVAEWILGNFYKHYSDTVSLWTLSLVDSVYSSSVLTIPVINLILLFCAVITLAWFGGSYCSRNLNKGMCSKSDSPG